MDEPQDLAQSLNEEAGYEALRGHVVEKARLARARHGPVIDEGAMLRILLDPEVIRFPTVVRYDAEPLQPGEFAWPMPRGEKPSDGFTLVIHPCFEGRPDVMPLLAAYHVVAINYLDLATHVEAELFGATLLGMEVDDYYERLCRLCDEIATVAT
jgi:hypothetical protein